MDGGGQEAALEISGLLSAKGAAFAILMVNAALSQARYRNSGPNFPLFRVKSGIRAEIG